MVFSTNSSGRNFLEAVSWAPSRIWSFFPGDKVIPLYMPQCRKCKFCLSPLTNFCTKLR